MAYKIEITANAKKELSKLSPQVQKRIGKKILFLTQETDPIKSAKALVDHTSGQYRWRIGDYRVVFDVKGKKIIILKIQPRKDIYKKK